jgi:molecular chaperone DnaK (HSP70)
MKRNEIDEVVLVGGSTRIPRLNNLSRISSTKRNPIEVSIQMKL